MPSAEPQTPPSTGEKRKRAPDDPQASIEPPASPNSSTSTDGPDSKSKRQRVIGPTLPPANLNERPVDDPNQQHADSSEDDDDFGPALPSKDETSKVSTSSKDIVQPSVRPEPVSNRRDEWMIVPPSNSDWTARVDPTKLKNRKFNTGKGAKGHSQATSGGDHASWHETPAEKQARLQREMMGIKDVSKELPQEDKKSNEMAAQKLREYAEKSRGATLYDAHQKTNPSAKEDDPSARAFDREKDIAGGMKINTTQRREMMHKATDFGSRFSSAKYL